MSWILLVLRFDYNGFRTDLHHYVNEKLQQFQLAATLEQEEYVREGLTGPMLIRHGPAEMYIDMLRKPMALLAIKEESLPQGY